MAKMRHYYQTMLGDPETGKRHGKYGHIKFQSVSTKKRTTKTKKKTSSRRGRK